MFYNLYKRSRWYLSPANLNRQKIQPWSRNSKAFYSLKITYYFVFLFFTLLHFE